MSSIPQEIARLCRIRLDHVEQHTCRGLCDQAAYMQQLINDGHRWIEEGQVAKPVPTGTFYEIGIKIRKALVVDTDAQFDVIRCALLLYEVLSPGEVLLLEKFERDSPAQALQWTRGVLREGGAKFEFTS